MPTPLRIVYLGSPPFAVPMLKTLHESHHHIVGVVTAPDKPAGRGKQIRQTAIKQFAVEAGLPVLQPSNLKASIFQDELRALKADVQVVVAFRMLPEAVWNMPAHGTINLHASLLPAYRGAAPIHWAIMNGETETGLTTFRLAHEIDTGRLLFQKKMPIGPNETTGELMQRMMPLGAELMLRTLDAIASGETREVPQDLSGTYPKAPKLFRENTRIDWHQPALAIHNQIRGLNPRPSAWMKLANGDAWKLHRSALPDPALTESFPADVEPGHVLTQEDRMFIRCGGDWLEILNLQAAGKRSMDSKDFLRGWRGA